DPRSPAHPAPPAVSRWGLFVARVPVVGNVELGQFVDEPERRAAVAASLQIGEIGLRPAESGQALALGQPERLSLGSPVGRSRRRSGPALSLDTGISMYYSVPQSSVRKSRPAPRRPAGGSGSPSRRYAA